MVYDLWLKAAYNTLLESGVDAVKILPLAKKMNLSRTSFYWFFTSREELLGKLLQLWKDKNTGAIIERTNAYAENLAEAALNVSDCWFNNDLFDSKLEFAIRSWAMQSKDILQEVRKADEDRLEALARMFMRFGMEPVAADVRAQTIYLMQIGYIAMQTEEDILPRLKRMPEYIKIFTDAKPPKGELRRFLSRYNVDINDIIGK